MGLLDWIRHVMKTTQVYIIEEKHIEAPKEGECLVFVFPKGTPKAMIKQFEKRMVEFQNSMRDIIITDMKFEVIRHKKDQLAVVEQEGGDKNAESDRLRPGPAVAAEGPDEERNRRARSKR